MYIPLVSFVHLRDKWQRLQQPDHPESNSVWTTQYSSFAIDLCWKLLCVSCHLLVFILEAQRPLLVMKHQTLICDNTSSQLQQKSQVFTNNSAQHDPKTDWLLFLVTCTNWVPVVLLKCIFGTNAVLMCQTNQPSSKEIIHRRYFLERALTRHFTSHAATTAVLIATRVCCFCNLPLVISVAQKINAANFSWDGNHPKISSS